MHQRTDHGHRNHHGAAGQEDEQQRKREARGLREGEDDAAHEHQDHERRAALAVNLAEGGYDQAAADRACSGEGQ